MVIDVGVKDLAARDSDLWVNADISRARRALEEAREDAVEAVWNTRYFVRQADWLQDHFTNVALRDVNGLVRLADRATVAAHEWSLTPGRYVGVAPEEWNEAFDFEEELRTIHVSLDLLNDLIPIVLVPDSQGFPRGARSDSLMLPPVRGFGGSIWR